MPTYEYRCNGCGRDFEYVQRMSDDDLVKCEVCGEDKLEKLISRTAFQLKGGGWYKDLYASTKPADSSASGGSSTPSTTSTDTPAAKADAPAAAASSSSDSSSSSSSTPAAAAPSTPSKPPSSAT